MNPDQLAALEEIVQRAEGIDRDPSASSRVHQKITMWPEVLGALRECYTELRTDQWNQGRQPVPDAAQLVPNITAGPDPLVDTQVNRLLTAVTESINAYRMKHFRNFTGTLLLNTADMAAAAEHSRRHSGGPKATIVHGSTGAILGVRCRADESVPAGTVEREE